MNGIKEIILGFCAAAVFLGALSIIAPSAAERKSVKYVLSLVFLACCVTLFSGVGRISLKSGGTSATDYKNLIAMGNTQAEYICCAALKDANIPYEKVCADTNIDESGDIYINEIKVYSSYNGEEIKQTIKKTVQTKSVEVINE